MNEGLIPSRYAKALYKVAVDRKEQDAIYALMNKLVESAQTEPALNQAISNPFVSDADKCSLLKAAVAPLEPTGTYADFLKLLVENRRLSMAIDIARAYGLLYRRELKIARVKVTSASQLSDDELQRLKKLISSHLNGGTMEFSTDVDPGLIGGFAINIDNERLDASVKNELKQLRLNLLK